MLLKEKMKKVETFFNAIEYAGEEKITSCFYFLRRNTVKNTIRNTVKNTETNTETNIEIKLVCVCVLLCCF